MDQKYGKAYKLCSRKAIDTLFEKKSAVKQYPFVLNFAPMELPTDKSFQVVISAPKRIFRRAHDRNRVKRLSREVLRRKKGILENFLAGEQRQIALFLVYTSKEELKYSQLEQKMEQLLNKLVKELKDTKHDQTH